jgi:ADP-heptose:LPS heptosyltransferase
MDPISLDLGSIEGYGCVLTEIIKYVSESTSLLLESPLEVVAESLEPLLSNIQLKFEVPEEIKRANRLPEKNTIRIGLDFDSMGGIKSYPNDLQPVLVHSLKALGVELYFFGTKPLSPDIDLFNSRLHDLTGKTSIPELTVLLEQMDIIIGVDSFVSHLAAVIGKPIVVLLSTTNKAYFNHYQKVRTMASEETCAPCFHTGNQCPREYTRCCKFHHESVLPDKIVMTAVKEILRLYSGRNEHK